jgi:hypothetical protein
MMDSYMMSSETNKKWLRTWEELVYTIYVIKKERQTVCLPFGTGGEMPTEVSPSQYN